MSEQLPDDPQKIIPEVDQDLCIGAQSCALIAPRTFGMNAEGKAYVLGGDHDDEATMLAAAESCPVRAIKLARANGQSIFPK
jgi:ferredoxin